MLRWLASVLLIAAAGVTEFHFVARAGGFEKLTGNDFLLATIALELALVTWLLWSLVEKSLSGVRIASVCLLGNLGAQFYLFDLVGPDPSAGELQRFYLAGIGVIVFALINIMLGARDDSDTSESAAEGRPDHAGAGKDSGNGSGQPDSGSSPDPERLERAAQMARYELEAEGKSAEEKESASASRQGSSSGSSERAHDKQEVPERPATPDPAESTERGAGLVAVSGPATGEFYEFTEGEDSWVLGRSARADITISDPAVSREHCEIRRSDTGFTVEDLDSTNGTFVNDAEIDGSEALEAGDRLQMGGVTLRLEGDVPADREDESDPAEN